MSKAEFALSLGGSLIVPDQEIRVPYLRQFGALLRERVELTSQHTAIVTGGGETTRKYQRTLKELGVTDPVTLDKMGIHPTHTNALLLALALEKAGIKAQYLRSLNDPLDPACFAWVTGGTHAGQTTDAVLVEWSKQIGIQTVINATNVAFVYEINAGQVDRTKPIKNMSWQDYFVLFEGVKHTPGESLPFGATAAQIASRLGITAFVLDGNNLVNLGNVFAGRAFEGTMIHP